MLSRPEALGTPQFSPTPSPSVPTLNGDPPKKLVLTHYSPNPYLTSKEGFGEVWVNTSTFGGSPFKVGTEGLGVGENCGVPKASGRESMIRSDYVDHGRSSRAIIMTKGRTLHCERETGGVTI